MKNDDKKPIEVKNVLMYLIKGYSYGTIGQIFHVSRQYIQQLHKDNKNEPRFKKLYIEIENTRKYLNRKIT